MHHTSWHRPVLVLTAFLLVPVLTLLGVWVLLLQPPSSRLSRLPEVSPPLPFESSDRRLTETDYCDLIAEAQAWQSEVRTSVGTRVDLVTPEYAIEVDWPHKWAEAVGQSLHYGYQLDLQPCALFLLSSKGSDPGDQREYVLARIEKTCREHGIKIMWFDTETLELLK